MPQAVEIDPVRHGGPALRTFANLSREWRLSLDEQLKMLSIDDVSVFDDLIARAQSNEQVAVPLQLLFRLGCVFSIYASLRMLLPHDRDEGWLRAANQAPIFGGKCALDLMTTCDLDDLYRVKVYLNEQAEGPVVDQSLDILGPTGDYDIVFVDENGSPS